MKPCGAVKLCAALSLAAYSIAGGSAEVPPPASAPIAAVADTPAIDAPGERPDDELIEFLGADDVGDTAWWEFFNRTAAHQDKPPPEPPPQDANK